MIKLIAIDMDGTILSPELTISEKNKQAILAAQSSGIEVVIATGRSYIEAFDPVQDAGLDLAYICLNGAEVRDQSGNILDATHLYENDIPKITSILESENIDYQLFVGEDMYTRDTEQIIDIFIQLAEAAHQIPAVDKIRAEVIDRVKQGAIHEVDSFDPIIQKYPNGIYKVFGSSNSDLKLDRARETLNKLPHIAVSSSGAGNLEITSINAQKGIAVEKYAQSKGISMENVMVIGDSYNDLSMMKHAGHSVAMGNARADIKAACHTVTATNEHDGVGLAIEAILQPQVQK